MSNKNMLNNIVTSIAIEVLYTFTIVSAYFIIQLTRSPVNARLKTTNDVRKLAYKIFKFVESQIPSLELNKPKEEPVKDQSKMTDEEIHLIVDNLEAVSGEMSVSALSALETDLGYNHHQHGILLKKELRGVYKPASHHLMD